ncbi:hypothetical protein [Longispora urticae]
MAMIEVGEASAFVDRFLGFEDALVTEMRLHLPVLPASERALVVDIQAMDTTRKSEGLPGTRLYEWCLVRLTIGGILEYRLAQRERYFNTVLSDGLHLLCDEGRWILDLDPSPDEWSVKQLLRSEQYVIGSSCEYEVLDIPTP